MVQQLRLPGCEGDGVESEIVQLACDTPAARYQGPGTHSGIASWLHLLYISTVR